MNECYLSLSIYLYLSISRVYLSLSIYLHIYVMKALSIYLHKFSFISDKSCGSSFPKPKKQKKQHFWLPRLLCFLCLCIFNIYHLLFVIRAPPVSFLIFAFLLFCFLASSFFCFFAFGTRESRFMIHDSSIFQIWGSILVTLSSI